MIKGIPKRFGLFSKTTKRKLSNSTKKQIHILYATIFIFVNLHNNTPKIIAKITIHKPVGL